MLSHDGFNGLGRFVGIVEWDGRDEMVEDVRFDDAVEQVPTDEAKLPINRRCGAAGEVPRLRLVVRKSRIGVLKEGDGDYFKVSTCQMLSVVEAVTYRASGLPTGTEQNTTQLGSPSQSSSRRRTTPSPPGPGPSR